MNWITFANTTDRVPPDGDNRGERQITESVLHSGRIIFTTLFPATAPCTPGCGYRRYGPEVFPSGSC